MENFELIDRFFEKDLTKEELQEFERRLNEEDAFQDDLQFYEAMNKGVYSLEREKLKKKLDELYEAYNPNEGTKKGYPFLWITSIAASVLIAGYFFIFRVGKPTEEIAKSTEPQKEEQIDQDSTEKEAPPNEMETADPGESNRLPDGVLAFGGIATLPPDQVMTLVYPKPLFYSFDGARLRLIGDPLMPALALDIARSENTYQLHYLDQAYSIQRGNDFTPLDDVTPKIEGTASAEMITVIFESILSSATRDDQIKVKINRQRGKPGFVFDDSNEITLAGNFELHNTQVFRVNFRDEEYLLVKRESDLFMLEGKPTSRKDMVMANTVNSKLVSLFEHRPPVQLNVLIP